MITLKQNTIDLIQSEMVSIPEKYQKPFNSNHEGYAILLEEVRELEQEIFFGEKPLRENAYQAQIAIGAANRKEIIDEHVKKAHKEQIRKEAVQIAAMACRIIQELTV